MRCKMLRTATLMLIGTSVALGVSVIHAAIEADDPVAIRAALADGSDVNERCVDQDWTPLMHGVLSNKRKAVKALLALGADTGSSDSRGYTPMHAAAIEGTRMASLHSIALVGEGTHGIQTRYGLSSTRACHPISRRLTAGGQSIWPAMTILANFWRKHSMSRDVRDDNQILFGKWTQRRCKIVGCGNRHWNTCRETQVADT
mmetsp:Transcript_66285/g.110121  ORF Transcript_66285/g.110121 Transcript_66285/m.110121 type:complete len:202 (-) Transcript_66285:253-858(-)